jgi:hypothetical protein
MCMRSSPDYPCARACMQAGLDAAELFRLPLVVAANIAGIGGLLMVGGAGST